MRLHTTMIAALACACLAAPAASGATPEQALSRALARQMGAAGSHSGAIAVDLDSGRTLFARRPDIARAPASNEKLYTTASALVALGPRGHLTTRVLGNGTLDAGGTFHGSLYLKGGGDPTFGSTSFTQRAYGTGATDAELARRLADAGVKRVRGGVYGDETYFDRRRGTPAEGYAASFEVEGELSALAYNRGLASENGGSFQSKPAIFAAGRFRSALIAQGIPVAKPAAEQTAPAGSQALALALSPTIATLAGLTNRPSDNFFAEMLIKGLGARFGAGGTTTAGAAVVGRQVNELGAHPRAIVDGSGLSRGDRTSPRQILRLLAHMKADPTAGPAFFGSLAVAGRSGTIAGRMNGTAAAGRCRAKTGTLSDVSALSGYCTARGGHTIAFSILMNGVGVDGARSLQDRMCIAMARYRPT